MSHPLLRKSISLLLLPIALSSCGGRDSHFQDFTFAGAGDDFNDAVYYSDEFFEAPSTEYNPHLASASIGFAMASFASGNQKNVQSLTRYANIQKLLTDTGFTDFEANGDFKKKSELDTIGLVFANKKIEDKTLVYVGLRGANYEAEWASNLSIADPNVPYVLETEPTYHYGFRKAADQFIRELSGYLADKGITGPIKLWTSGYSRAGATANLASGLLDQAIEKGEHPLGENVSLAKEDLYAYCFEPPMGAPADVDEEGKLLARGSMYSNIFNHVNFNDVVPMVAMKEVNFTRFGQDRFFPDKMSYINDGGFSSRAISNFEHLSAYQARGGQFLIPSFEIKTLTGFKLIKDSSYVNWTQGLFLKEFVSALTTYALGARSQEDIPEAKNSYVKNIQPAARFLFELIYLSGNFKGSLIDLGVSFINDIVSTFEVDELINDIVHKDLRPYFMDDLFIILRRGLEKLGIEGITYEQTKEKIGAFMQLLLSFFDFSFDLLEKPQLILSWISRNNVKSIASGHYPEYCLSCVRALDSYYGENPFVNTNHAGKYFTLRYFSTDTNLIISKKDATRIAEIHGGKILFSSVPLRVTPSQIEVILPYGEEYRIEVGDKNEILTAHLYDYTYRSGDIGATLYGNSDGSYSLS